MAPEHSRQFAGFEVKKHVDAMRFGHMARRFIRERDHIGADKALRLTLKREVELCVLQLRSRREMTLTSRSIAADYLERLAKSPQALAAVDRSFKVKRGPRGRDIAIDYLVSRRLLGKSTSAAGDVAKAWRVSKMKVKHHVDYWRKDAQAAIDDLIAEHKNLTGGSPPELYRSLSSNLRSGMSLGRKR